MWGKIGHYRHSGLTDLKRRFPNAQMLLENHNSASCKSSHPGYPDSDKKRVAAWRGTGPRSTVRGALYRHGEGQALALQ